VDNRELIRGESLRLGEVARKPVRNRDLRVRETSNGAVGCGDDRARPELVESVLRAYPHRDTREGGGREAEHVGVHEMRVQDVRPPEREPRRHTRIEV